MASTREVLAAPLVAAARDHDVLVVDTDTGSVKLAAELDYVNVGIAEATAVGLAAGVAASGRRVLICAFSAFVSARAFEFVKLDIAYPRRQVCIAATHGGVSAGWLGPTHHALEDTLLMSALPHMVVLVPADLDQATELLRQALNWPGPTYLRLGRKDSPPLPAGVEPARIGHAIQLREGTDMCVVASGPELVHAALGAAEALAGTLDVQVVVVHSIASEFADQLATVIAPAVRGVLTLEESWPGGPVERLARHALQERRPLIAVKAMNLHGFCEPARHHDILSEGGMTAEAIAAQLIELSNKAIPRFRGEVI